VDQVIALFREAEAVDAEISRVYRSASDNRRLATVGLHARGLVEGFSRSQPSVAKTIVLPDWNWRKMLSMPSGALWTPKLFAGTSLDKARRMFGRMTEGREA
jgi:hypothetical protein